MVSGDLCMPAARAATALVLLAWPLATWAQVSASPTATAPATATATATSPAAARDAAVFRHHAPITVEQPVAFVRLPLPVSAYAMSRQPGLADLRVVDARGERVPFALLGARGPQAREVERARPADLYPLPPRRRGDADLASPLEVQVVGERITVRRLAPGRAATAAGAVPAGAPPPVPGWLFDLGERGRDEPPATTLRLAWAEPAEFTAAYELDLSDDLRQWRRAGGGQLLALKPAAGQSGAQSRPGQPVSLAQRDVKLPVDAGPASARFVRLRWLDPAGAPALTGAQQLRVQRSAVEPDAPTSFDVAPGPEPGAPAAALGGAVKTVPAEGALHYDLGAALPVVAIDLPLPAGHRLAPVRVQGRVRVDEPWRDLAQTVFYRIERGDVVDRPPPLSLAGVAIPVRYLRLVPDARAGALPAAQLAVRAQLQSVVFTPQGQPPFRLLAGSADAPPGALPLATLVPALETERARFGRAQLGAWSESAEAARAEAWQARLTAWRPALLWAVLLAGVGGLGFAVWRLARKPAASAGQPSG